MPAAPPASVLERFGPAARAWFTDTFAAPTRAQELGWDAISAGEHTLLLAPTGSGKTLAAFLWCLDKLTARPPLPAGKNGRPAKREGVSVLYISPLKALSYDVERNLRAPLAGLRIAAAREGMPLPDITVGTRTGDTPQREREDIRKDPPDILITTPESLYLMLTSRSREVLRKILIADELDLRLSQQRKGLAHADLPKLASAMHVAKRSLQHAALVCRIDNLGSDGRTERAAVNFRQLGQQHHRLLQVPAVPVQQGEQIRK